MTLKSILLTVLCAGAVLSGQAAPRSPQAMQQAALSVLGGGMGSATKAPLQLRTLRQGDAYAVVAGGGAFAVVSTDDLLPAVLGYGDDYSDEAIEQSPFGWYLRALDATLAEARRTRQARAAQAPDTVHYAAKVSPLVATRWSQDDPFNARCPMFSGQHCITGCVATAMAQVMSAHVYPATTEGNVITNNSTGEPFTLDMNGIEIAWDKMLTYYSQFYGYTQENVDAVATLMLACGMSVGMLYTTEYSAAVATDCAKALRRNFRFTKTVRYCDRSDYDDETWMQLVYDNLNQGLPVIYCGQDNVFGGHCFVLDGYNEKGLMHVNWGWTGAYNGYYDIDVLNPMTYAFSSKQEMICGIDPLNQRVPDSNLTELAVESAEGQLATAVGNGYANYNALKITGVVGESDWEFLRRMGGIDPQGRLTPGRLARLDLSEATLTDRCLPAHALEGCRFLQEVILPKHLSKIGIGAFAQCVRLDHVEMPELIDEQVVEGPLVLNREKTIVQLCIPGSETEVEVPMGITEVADEAFTGCASLEKLRLPRSVVKLGQESLAYMYRLRELHVGAFNLPDAPQELLTGIDGLKCRLYVAAGRKTDYRQTSPWRDIFGDNVDEEGKGIIARPAFREYGEQNPRLKYSFINTDRSIGVPELVCDATQESPAGSYEIRVLPGTITDDDVNLVGARLTVNPVEVMATVGNYKIGLGEDIPDFEVRLTADWKLDDTVESVVLEWPNAYTTATKGSPVGNYPIYVQGGRTNGNYNLVYGTSGVLTISTETAIGDAKAADEQQGAVYYSLDGRRLAAPQRGINIIRKADGSAKKISR